jgi:acyl dehydratase
VGVKRGSLYRVQACNLSHASENRIHDDGVAREFGFQGALVPGVEVYAYMSHLPVARWGVDWLERGTAECRFLKPVYDGKFVSACATEGEAAFSIRLESEGELCATGGAALPQAPSAAPGIPEAVRIPEADERPDADEESLATGRRMSSPPLHLTVDYLQEYIASIRETDSLYVRERLMHPAIVLRLANSALKANVRLGPWIHAASTVRHWALACAGDVLVAHAQVAANYERKGHRFVDLDVVVVADGVRAIAQVRHTVIYRLRSPR